MEPKYIIIAGVIILVLIALAMMFMPREKYNAVPPTFIFSSMDNSIEEDPTKKKCYGKKWKSH